MQALMDCISAVCVLGLVVLGLLVTINAVKLDQAFAWILRGMVALVLAVTAISMLKSAITALLPLARAFVHSAAVALVIVAALLVVAGLFVRIKTARTDGRNTGGDV